MRPFGYPRFFYESVTSTNDVAKELVRQNVPDGALVVASHQTAGRGRRGASWISERCDSALITFVTYPKMSLAQIWRVPIATSVAVYDALTAFGVPVRLKWPNDLLCNGTKIGGILVETVALEDGFAALLGIGINVNQTQFPAIADAAHPAGSLAMILGRHHPSVGRVIEAIAGTLPPLVGDCENDSAWAGVLDSWRKALITGIEQSGVAAETGHPVRGILRSVRNDGAALLEDVSGNLVAALPSGTLERTSRV